MHGGPAYGGLHEAIREKRYKEVMILFGVVLLAAIPIGIGIALGRRAVDIALPPPRSTV